METTNNSYKNAIKPIVLEVFERKIILIIPKNEQDISFIRTILYSKWDKVHFQWTIPNYPGNLERIQHYFGKRIEQYIEHETEVFDVKNPNLISTKKRNEVMLIKTKNKRIRILAGFQLKLMNFIKKIPYNSWDSTNKWWTIPYSEPFLHALKQEIVHLGLVFSYQEEGEEVVKAKKVTSFDIANYKNCPKEFILKIKELRYSLSTEKTYKSALEDYLNFHHTIDIKQLNEGHIQSFLRHLVMERKVSTSYQNQAINAIKFYYERVLGGQRKTYFIDRPKSEKSLPVVLSEEEIVRILKKVENLKHLAILLVIYSAGLRISECVNLKIKDIDSSRMQIRVEQAKGKKDRYTILSTKTLDVLRNYFKVYRPKNYLFEGQFDEKYSTRSIQNIFKKAVLLADIKNRSLSTVYDTVSPHTCLKMALICVISNLY